MARKIEFDRDIALNQSMMLFWEKGYENTSVQDLVETLELNRFSIYNTFGDKNALFLLAMEQYRTQLFETLNAPLNDTKSNPKQRLDNYLKQFGDHLVSSQGQFGCLIQNSVMGDVLQYDDIRTFVMKAFADLESALIHTLEDAKTDGELEQNCDTEAAATHVLSSIQGLILLRKMGKNTESIKSQIRFLRETVAKW